MNPLPKNGRSWRVVIAVLGLFLLPVIGARVWLTSGDAVGLAHYVITPRTLPAARPFKIVALTESALEILGFFATFCGWDMRGG